MHHATMRRTLQWKPLQPPRLRTGVQPAADRYRQAANALALGVGTECSAHVSVTFEQCQPVLAKGQTAFDGAAMAAAAVCVYIKRK